MFESIRLLKLHAMCQKKISSSHSICSSAGIVYARYMLVSFSFFLSFPYFSLHKTSKKQTGIFSIRNLCIFYFLTPEIHEILASRLYFCIKLTLFICEVNKNYLDALRICRVIPQKFHSVSVKIPAKYISQNFRPNF
jgi:hypothetical protein